MKPSWCAAVAVLTEVAPPLLVKRAAGVGDREAGGEVAAVEGAQFVLRIVLLHFGGCEGGVLVLAFFGHHHAALLFEFLFLRADIGVLL
jgi:hypothetical protein